MSNNDYILDAVKGEPNSLTSIAFNTGVIAERARIIKLLQTQWLPIADVEACIALIKGENE